MNQNDPSFGWDTHAAIAAQAAARDLAYDYAGHCSRFFNEGGVRFWEMSPQSGLAGNGACLAQPGVEYVVYLASGGITTVDLSAASGRKLSVRWFNPRTGKFQFAEAVQGGNVHTNSNRRSQGTVCCTCEVTASSRPTGC